MHPLGLILLIITKACCNAKKLTEPVLLPLPLNVILAVAGKMMQNKAVSYDCKI